MSEENYVCVECESEWEINEIYSEYMPAYCPFCGASVSKGTSIQDEDE